MENIKAMRLVYTEIIFKSQIFTSGGSQEYYILLLSSGVSLPQKLINIMLVMLESDY